MSFIEITNLLKEYESGGGIFAAVDRVSLQIDEGEFVLLLGDSGAGKSTLLNLLGGLDSIDGGGITVAGRSIGELDAHSLTRYRRESVGFVFQFYNLINTLNVTENVEIVENPNREHMSSAELLKYLNLSDRKKYFPSQLSGGEQQRVAIARALYKNPDLLLCDEPTGALDYQNSKNILALLQKINRETNKTIVMVTHNNALEPIAKKVVKMRSGKIIDVRVNAAPVDVEKLEW